MRQVSLDNVVPGMVTARHVYPPGDAGGVPLLAAKVTITEGIRERLVKANVAIVLIDDDLSEGIEVHQPITDEVRRSAIGVVRDTFVRMREPGAMLDREQVKDVEGTINAILTEIATRRNLLVCLSDLNVFGGERMQHAVNVCVLGCSIGRTFFGEHGWRDFRGQRRDDGIADRLQKLGIGLLLQDIGTLAVPEGVREKRGILTAEERALMQQHPVLGVEMLEGVDLSPLTKVTIAQHHERFDGTGYPKGLAGDEIHDHGQIAAIAEAYVSLCRNDQGTRRRPFMPHEAYDLIVKASGKLFHPHVVAAFQQSVAPYGAGTTVQLSDGRYAIVVSNNVGEPLRPMLRVTHDGNGLLFQPQTELDLTRHPQLSISAATEGLPSDRPAADTAPRPVGTPAGAHNR